MKGESRNRLICVRDDGSYVESDLGPRLPYHDLAHYVSEKMLGLSGGFYGNIRSGFSIEQLSDKHIIKKLGPESFVAEVVARSLQLLSSAACTREEFPHIIKQEMEIFGIRSPIDLSKGNTKKMLTRYDQLVEEWNALPEGEMLELEF